MTTAAGGQKTITAKLSQILVVLSFYIALAVRANGLPVLPDNVVAGGVPAKVLHPRTEIPQAP